MKYVALLRGINVGGNSKIAMVELKKVFEELGFEEVVTYINSGNVVFSSPESVTKITKEIEKSILKNFKLPIRVVIKSQSQIQKVIEEIPLDWKNKQSLSVEAGKNDIRCYVAFVLDSSSEKDIEREVELREGIDFLKVGPAVLYMTTKMSGLTKSKFSKLAAKKIYKEITIRNFNTVKKISELMQK